MKKDRIIVLAFIILFVIAACVTVNIYFPAAEVQKAADKIVSDVRGDESGKVPDAQPEKKGKDKESRLKKDIRIPDIFLKDALAEMDIEVSTPAIRSLKESLKDRFAQLKPFYEDGRVGETNRGTIEIKDIEGLGLKEKSSLLKLVEEENKDRTELYKEILKANNLGSENLGEVEKIFANSWRKDTPKGWWIQTDEGEWIRKQ